MGTIAEAVEKERDYTGYLPAAITGLGLEPGMLNDPWGNPYIYTFLTEEPGYDIISHGKDGAPGTADDIKLTGLGEMWANYIQIKGDDESGRMTLHFGEKSVVIQGDDQGGNIKVNAGDRIIEITGNDDGGRVNVTSTATTRPSEGTASQPDDAPAPPDPPQH